MRIGLKQTLDINREDNRIYRRRYLILILLIAVLFLIFVNEQGNGAAQFYTPLKTWEHIGLWIKINVTELLHIPNDELQLQADFEYSFTPDQVKRLLISMACGALLALSGNIFQNVFRNPMAAPTMLGVNTGVNIAMLYLAVTYGSAITAMPGVKYRFCYIGAAGMLVFVMLLGKCASGKHKFSVDDLLLVGVASSNIIGAVVTGYTQAMDTDVLAVYQMLSSGANVDISAISVGAMAIAFFASMIPMCLLRFSFNVVTNTPDETRGLGIDSNIFRFITLVIGTFMMTAAMVHCGAVGMVSLAVPFVGRSLFGQDFRRQFWANMLLGALFLLICRGIANLFPYVGYAPFPISVIINIVIPPIFAVAIAKGKRSWE